MQFKASPLSKLLVIVATIFVCALVYPFSASAGVGQKECKDVDLRATLGPIRNQGNIGWCYANGAADMAGFVYAADLHGTQVSAIDLAVAYNHYVKLSDTGEGGWAFIALNLVKWTGLCPRWVEDQIIGPNTRDLRHRLLIIDNLKRLYDSGNIAAVRQQVDEIKTRYKDFNETELWKVFEASSKRDFLWDFAQVMCRQHRVFPAHWKMARAEYKFSSLLPRIHEELNKNHPVTVDFHSGFLNDDPKNENHLSVIAGRKWNMQTKQCDLILRNSWGPACNVYTPKNWGERCEKGNLLIPEEELDRQGFGVSYVP